MERPPIPTEAKALLAFFGVVLLAAIAFIIYATVSRVDTAGALAEGPIDLSKFGTVLSYDKFKSIDDANAFLKGNSATFQCFLYFDSLSRTGAALECGKADNQPDCDTQLYRPCKCASADGCENCEHKGYLRLFSLFDVYRMEILNVQDASRPNAVAAQLTLKTEAPAAGGKTVTVETIALPPIPVQKWTMVTVSREGRRLDIYYNDQIVSSSMTANVISMTGPGSVLTMGQPGLSGAAAFIRMSAGRSTVQSVAAAYARATDTRGEPLGVATDPNTASATITNSRSTALGRALCLDGSCLKAPRIRGPAVTLISFGDLAGSSDKVGTEFSKLSPVYDVQTDYA